MQRPDYFSVAKKEEAESFEFDQVENEKLSTRLRVLEENGGGKDAHHNLTQRAEEVEKGGRIASSKEAEELKAKVNAAELKNKRLIEAFQVHTAEKKP